LPGYAGDEPDLTGDTGADDQRRLLQESAQRTGLPLEQLWLRYFALGGSCGLIEVEAHLHGMMPLPAYECDMLAHATTERLDELDDEPQRAESRPARPAPVRGDDGAALVSLLRHARCATPDQLGEIAVQAGRALGADLVVYLIDHDQALLVPVPSPVSAGRAPLDVDATLAGRVYRSGQVLPLHSGSRPHLLVPLRDGVDRLGVLDLLPDNRFDVGDPTLHERMSWLASLLSALVVSLDAIGDGVEVVRRQRSRSPAAELLRALVPPATAGTSNLQLAAWIAPAAHAGGDAYDYDFDRDTVTFAIYDAMGHGFGSGLVAAAALAASRSARRDGAALQEQLAAADAVVAEHFDDSTFLTAFLGLLDLRTGSLRYVRAGHAPPLLLRQGQVVKTLGDGSRLPVGLSAPRSSTRLGTASLHPGDWVVLSTDGVTEARDPNGAFFGEARLVDYVTREIASGHPPPETGRRLAQAVMSHQQGTLQDDATIMLLRWDGPEGPR
jgi:hypothetical protein